MSPSTTRRPLPGSPFNVPTESRPIEVYAVGDRVSHDRYGLGTVVGVESTFAVTIECGQNRVRVTSPFTNIERLQADSLAAARAAVHRAGFGGPQPTLQ